MIVETPVEANWDIYYSTYVAQNGGGLTPGGQVTGQLSGTGPDTVIGFPYAGLSVDKHAYSDTNLTWFERYKYREKTSNESTYMEGLLRSGLESFRSEDYLPTNMAWRSFFAVQDAQINSALASAAYLAASASDMSEERRRSLTLTVGGLANLLGNAATVKSGVAPVTGSLGIRKPPAATPLSWRCLKQMLLAFRLRTVAVCRTELSFQLSLQRPPLEEEPS